jgi:23S rRNA pseudouridine1911/1915/1917 synthase
MSTPRGTTLSVAAEAEGTRLDVFLLSAVPPGVSRARIQRAIKDGQVTVDQKQIVKPSSVLHTGQTIRVSPDVFTVPAAPTVVPDPTILLHILHEDPSLIVVDKPAGIPVHAGVRNEHPTLVDALIARYPALRDVGEDPLRPGIVHRLDKDTSGVLLVARTPELFLYLKRAFQARRVEKTYAALVRGVVTEDEGTIKLPLTRSTRNPLRRTVARRGEGKSAETSFRVRQRFAHYTLLDVFPKTGRMHQIRVHLLHLGFPVAGDRLYGKHAKDPSLPPLRRQFLHASSISVTLPTGRLKTFTSPLPEDLESVLHTLRAAEQKRAPKGRELRFRMRSPRTRTR